MMHSWFTPLLQRTVISFLKAVTTDAQNLFIKHKMQEKLSNFQFLGPKKMLCLIQCKILWKRRACPNFSCLRYIFWIAQGKKNSNAFFLIVVSFFERQIVLVSIKHWINLIAHSSMDNLYCPILLNEVDKTRQSRAQTLSITKQCRRLGYSVKSLITHNLTNLQIINV